MQTSALVLDPTLAYSKTDMGTESTNVQRKDIILCPLLMHMRIINCLQIFNSILDDKLDLEEPAPKLKRTGQLTLKQTSGNLLQLGDELEVLYNYLSCANGLICSKSVSILFKT